MVKEIDKAQELYAKKKSSIEIDKQLEPFAMWSFILSIAPFGSFLFFWIPFLNILFMLFLLIAPILSIIFAIIGFRNIGKNKKYYGNGFAIAGIIISVLEILIGIIGIMIFIVYVGNLY